MNHEPQTIVPTRQFTLTSNKPMWCNPSPALLIDTPIRTCSCCQTPITSWTPVGECDRCAGQAHAISLCAESYRFVIATAPTVTTARQLMLYCQRS